MSTHWGCKKSESVACGHSFFQHDSHTVNFLYFLTLKHRASLFHVRILLSGEEIYDLLIGSRTCLDCFEQLLSLKLQFS